MFTCSVTAIPDSTPRCHLTHEETAALPRYIKDHGAMDAAGTFGFLHAIASSPLMIPAELWQPVVCPTPHRMAPDAVADFHNLLCIAVNMVGFHLADGRALVPDERDFASFARGYLAGLATWGLHGREHFRCAPWACHLAGRLDLLPPAEAELFQTDPPRQEDLSDLIVGSMVITFDLCIGLFHEEPERPALLN